uniref:Uncharacterized protein n=1 Tax=Nothoprocta perdicaria TaxID=30464 RepID=A0A8C6YSH9_NOTPE
MASTLVFSLPFPWEAWKKPNFSFIILDLIFTEKVLQDHPLPGCSQSFPAEERSKTRERKLLGSLSFLGSSVYALFKRIWEHACSKANGA